MVDTYGLTTYKIIESELVIKERGWEEEVRGFQGKNMLRPIYHQSGEVGLGQIVPCVQYSGFWTLSLKQ